VRTCAANNRTVEGSRMPVRRSFAALVLAALVFSACTASGTTAAPAAQSPAAQSPAAASQASAPMSIVVGSATSGSLGSYLTDPNGMTLYTRTGDSATSSGCTGSCAVAWPPLLVATGGSATAGSGVTGTFATLSRADGTVQVTYQGLPLYGWKGDTKAGDVTGEGVNGFLVATLGGPVPVPSSTGKPGY
jgi:predicted lipoprotein with Yx(FWY)xxD motif